MRFEIEVAGRTRDVVVEPAGAGSYVVRVDGRARVVDARRIDASTLSLVLVDDDRASYEVGVVETGVPGELEVRVRGASVRAVVNGRRSRRGRADGDGPPGEQRVVAPMPGKVVRVLVAPGDQVAPRQPLVVVEAMKMENELLSAKAGRVKEVAVAAGMSVETGRLLIVVE